MLSVATSYVDAARPDVADFGASHDSARTRATARWCDTRSVLPRYDRTEVFILQGLVTVAEAQRMRSACECPSVARDLRDNLLMHLCAYPLGEAGPRSGLAELEVFARAVARERPMWERELGDRVGRHMIGVAATVARESREQGRWDLLLPLGAPSTNGWQAAMNVYTRVLSSRVVDGLMHSIVAADSLSTWPVPDAYDDSSIPGIRMIHCATALFGSWKRDRANREDSERQMMEMFRAGTWD